MHQQNLASCSSFGFANILASVLLRLWARIGEITKITLKLANLVTLNLVALSAKGTLTKNFYHVQWILVI